MTETTCIVMIIWGVQLSQQWSFFYETTTQIETRQQFTRLTTEIRCAVCLWPTSEILASFCHFLIVNHTVQQFCMCNMINEK